MRKIMTCVAVAAMTAMAHAQTTNRALTNADGKGMAEAFTLTELDDADEATFQMWVNPTAWTQATLIGQDNFSIEMGATEGQIAVKAGDGTATFTVDGMVGKWTQLTVTVAGGTVKAYADNTEVAVTGELPAQFEATATEGTKGCVIAEGLKGRMDEIRVWASALAQEDFFWQNTVNKWNDNYDILAAYWKCDQQLEGALLDYRHMNGTGHHNASLAGITKEAVTDNAAFRYRVVTGYVPSIIRFIDRNNSNRDMFLLTNDAITLSAKVLNDGTLFPEYPDNSCTPTNVNHLAEWEGHSGVMDFQGSGSQMVAADNRIPFSPESIYDNGCQQMTIEGWIYIDQWTEGAELLTNYKDDSNCYSIKLGSEADKELIVDLCGTTATLPGKLEVGKWQYVAVYFMPSPGEPGGFGWAPVAISIGTRDDNGTFQSSRYDSYSGATMGGSAMTISAVPALSGGTLTLGKNFDGKIDDLMVWGTNRSSSIEKDASGQYELKLNEGENWNNIFLNAYWRGDDPENVGKDSQSLRAIVDVMRSYYNGYSGGKIRIGIISALPNSGWKQVLNDDANLDRFIASAKELVKDFDGLDVDLEWAVEGDYWARYNHIVKRLIDEVMSQYPDKLFTVSLHAYSYAGFDMSLVDDIDYFTMQIYDWDLSMGTYESVYNNFRSVGFPDDKLLLSYPALVYQNPTYKVLIGGYKDLFEKWGMTDETFDPSLNQWTYNGVTYYYDGIDRIKEKQQFNIDHNVLGTMYFDMGNDLKVSDPKSVIRAQNEVISANVDTVMTTINLTTTGVRPIAARTGEELFTAVQDGDNINVTLADAATPATLAVYSVDGRAMMQMPLQGKQTAVPADGLGRGIYLLRVSQGSESHSVKIAIR